eukprot:1175826-Alexandrium_andersonii.AAC.1
MRNEGPAWTDPATHNLQRARASPVWLGAQQGAPCQGGAPPAGPPPTSASGAPSCAHRDVRAAAPMPGEGECRST